MFRNALRACPTRSDATRAAAADLLNGACFAMRMVMRPAITEVGERRGWRNSPAAKAAVSRPHFPIGGPP